MLIALTFLVIILTGLLTDIYLGDETIHYRISSILYETGKRPVYDPLMHYSEAGKRLFLSDVLWHYGLALFGKVSGGISKVSAQLYQALYYLVLVICTYLLSRRLYGEETALGSIFVLVSIPMVPVFSVILHTDIPIAVLAVLCFLMLQRKSYFAAGVFLGLSLVMKRTIYMLLPAIFWLTLIDVDDEFKGWLKRLVFLTVPAVLIMIPDSYFRIRHFGYDSFLMTPMTPARLHVPYLEGLSQMSPSEMPNVFVDVSNPVYDYTALFTHFGPLLFIFLILYLFRRKNKKDDRFIVLPVLSCFLIFLYLTIFLDIAPMLRHISLLIPFLAIIGALGLNTVKSRFLRRALLVLCLVQFLIASGYIYSKRKVPDDKAEAYRFVKESLHADARIMAVNDSALAFRTGRISQWTSAFCYRELDYLFWKADEEEALRIISRYGTDYILIENDRVYDDSVTRHLHDYPKSFVDKLPGFPFLEKIYSNEAVSIWKVR